jgi:hypothetical protein
MCRPRQPNNPGNVRVTADRVTLIDWDEAHVDVPDLDLVLPCNAAGLDDGAYAVSRLSGNGELAGPVDVFDEEIMAGALEAIAGAAASMGAAPLFVPEHWNFRGGLRFSSLAEDYEPTGVESFDLWLDRMSKGRLPVVEEPKGEAPRPERLEVNEIGQWRGATPLARPASKPDRMPPRMRARCTTLSPRSTESSSSSAPWPACRTRRRLRRRSSRGPAG